MGALHSILLGGLPRTLTRTLPPGSLSGSALTGMVTCLSQAPRNGDETYLSLVYSAEIAQLLNAPKQQPAAPLAKVLKAATKEYEKSRAIVAKGVQGKYQALRQAQVRQWEQVVNSLQGFAV